MTARVKAWLFGTVMLVLVLAAIHYGFHPTGPMLGPAGPAPSVSSAALSRAVAAEFPEVVSVSASDDPAAFPDGRLPSASFLARARPGTPLGLVPPHAVAGGGSLSSVITTPPTSYLVPVIVDGTTVAEFTLAPQHGDRLTMSEYDWIASDSKSYAQASAALRAALGVDATLTAITAALPAVVGVSKSEQGIVFLKPDPGSDDGSVASKRVEQAARLIVPYRLYMGAEALAVARLAYGGQ